MADSSAAKSSILSLSSLRRITTSGNYIPEIDGLRFVAILSVVLYHVTRQTGLCSSDQARTNPFWHLISHGDRGVQLFFVISGFILGMPFAAHLLAAKKPVRLREYFMRRLTRLEPPYILALAIRIPLLLAIMHQSGRMLLTHGIASLFYLHSLIFGTLSIVNPPAWSLEIEIQFYCLAPLFSWAYFKLRPSSLRRLLGLAFVVAAGIMQIYFFDYFPDQVRSRVTLSIVNYVQYFLTGFLLCDLYLSDWTRIPAHWLWDVVSIGTWWWIFQADGSVVHILLPVVALIAYIGAFKGVLLPRFFRTAWVSLIGGMCYSIYLTHTLAIAAVERLLHSLLSSPWLAGWMKVLTVHMVAVPVVLVAGLLLYITVERPCMDKNWPLNLSRRLRGVAKGEQVATTP